MYIKNPFTVIWSIVSKLLLFNLNKLYRSFINDGLLYIFNI